MPLKNGYGYATLQANIATLTREGYPPKQAQAIAFNHAKKCYKKRYPQGALPPYLGGPTGRRKNPKRPRTATKTPTTTVIARKIVPLPPYTVEQVHASGTMSVCWCKDKGIADDIASCLNRHADKGVKYAVKKA